MKKRFISLLLTVLMILSLFSGLSVNAYAATTAYGANTIEYTMGQGDYVLRICQKLGLNYYTCKDAIMILNNIYDGQWNKLAVGRVLTLPASDNDAVLIANGARTTTYNSGAAATTASTGAVVTGTATTGTVSTASTANFTNAGSADTLAYYLVPYTMSYGETVSGVCNNLGVNFSIFNPFIKQVNNISNWTKVRAGDTIIVPTPVCPVVGTTCYGVMQHVVTGSDTAYGIVTSKGISYNANELLLKALNQTSNLAAIKAGSNFFYPVPLTVSVPGTGNPGSTATTTTVTTTTDGNGTTTTSTTTTSKLYTLTSGMSASDGTMLFYVNNQAVTAAPAGAKVTVVTQTYSGRAIQSLTVKHTDGNADIHLSGDTFIMPGCNVRVDAAVKTGHDINIIANYSGKAAASVGGVSVQSAVKGAAVVIKSADPNYEISGVYASYKKMITASTKTALTVSSSNAFIMPDADVDVEVVLKPVSTYAFYVNDPVNGSFYLEVNGNAVTRAAKGTTVTVVAKPNTGYEPVSLRIFKHDDASKTVNVFSNSFTMPAFDVDVEVTFAGKGNNILIMPSQIATVLAFDEATYKTMGVAKLDDAVTEANSNSKVYLVAGELQDNGILQELDGKKYSIKKYEITRNSDGLMVKADPASGAIKNAYVFTMPKGGVTVTPIITAKDPVTVSGQIYMNSDTTAATSYQNCSFSVTYKDEGKEKRVEFTGKNDKSASIPVLEYVDLRTEVADGVAFVRYRIEPSFDGSATAADKADIALLIEEIQNEANTYGYFQIPDTDGKVTGYTIKAYFETGKVALGPAAITGNGSVGYKIKDSNGNWKSSNTCEPGEDVMIVVYAANGYKFDDSKYDPNTKFTPRLIVTRKDNGAQVPLDVDAGAGISLDPPDIQSYAYFFKMPASGVNVQAVFDPKPFVITMKCVDQAGNDLSGMGLWQAAINWVPGILDNTTNIEWFDFSTQFDVAYGDYVTVAMTEAGWSKYDMVSFRIDDKEYTADQLNYFYNFQMIDDRAKNLTITAVMKPKTVSAVHNLNAIYDYTKGGVQFLILKSASGYSQEYVSVVDPTTNRLVSSQFVNKAFAGDKIAIAAAVNDGKYTIKAKDIVVNSYGGDEDRIVVKEEYFRDDKGNELRFFTFTMPDSDVVVNVPFSGEKYAMRVVVTDKDGKPVSSMINLNAGAQSFADVAADGSFGQIEYNTLITILRSALCISENKAITKVDVQTDPGKTPVYYFDYSANSGGNGPAFNMPASNVTVYITVEDYAPAAYITFQQRLSGGSVEIHSGPSLSSPKLSASDIDVGDEVYVIEIPGKGYEHLGKGDLSITNNGVVYTVANWFTELPDGTNVWKLKVPNGLTLFSAEWPKEGADVLVENGAFAGDMTGGSVSFVKNGQPTLTFEPGTNLYIMPDADAGYSVPSAVEDIDVRDENGNKLPVEFDGTDFYIPGDKLKEDTGNVYVTVKFTAEEKEITFDLADSYDVTLTLGDGRSVTINQDTKYKLPAGTIIAVTSATEGYDEVMLFATAGTVAENVYVTPDKDATLTITLKTAANPIKWSATGASLTFEETRFNSDGSVKDVRKNVVSAEVGSKVEITATPDSGYNFESISVTRISDGSSVALSGSGPWTFDMPAGGVNVSATYVTEDSVTITFNPLGKKAKLTIDGLGSVDIDSSSDYYLKAGTVVKIQSAEDGCDKVKVTSAVAGGSKSDTTVSYTVTKNNDTLTIEMYSSAKAVTKNTVTNGAINLRKENDKDKVTYTEANFKAGDPIFIEAVPNLGYKLKSLKVTRNTDGANILGDYDTTSGLYPITDIVIPDGGITIKAEYELTSVTLNITPNVTGGAVGVVANVNTGNGISGDATITATYNQTISITPAAGYEWSSSAMTVTVNGNPVTVSGTGNNGARSFKIENVGTYIVNLGLIAKG